MKWNYAVIVWLLANVINMFICLLLFAIGKLAPDIIFYAGLIFLFGLFFSIPSVFLMAWLFHFIYNSHFSNQARMGIMIAGGIVICLACYLLFAITYSAWFFTLWPFSLISTAAVVLTIFLKRNTFLLQPENSNYEN